MKVVEIRYSRKFDLKGYENEDISLVATLDPNEDVKSAFDALKATAHILKSPDNVVEPTKAAELPKASKPSFAAPAAFSQDEFLRHEWKGKRLAEGSWAKGSNSYGWDFAVKNREDDISPFSTEALMLLDKGLVQLDGGFEVSLDESKTFVHIQKAKKRKWTQEHVDEQ
jgi:hypothetical protein